MLGADASTTWSRASILAFTAAFSTGFEYWGARNSGAVAGGSSERALVGPVSS
jgi:hypothetical protein